MGGKGKDKGKGGGKGGGGPGEKVFVGGLNKMTNDDTLNNYFSQYGNLVDVVVMKDQMTGESRGFGFVKYDSTQCVEAVMADYENHNIDGKWVEVKRADGKSGGGGGKGGGGGGKGGCFGPAPGAYVQQAVGPYW